MYFPVVDKLKLTAARGPGRNYGPLTFNFPRRKEIGRENGPAPLFRPSLTAVGVPPPFRNSCVSIETANGRAWGGTGYSLSGDRKNEKIFSYLRVHEIQRIVYDRKHDSVRRAR